MIALLLCIISTSMIMVIFKIAGRRKIDPFNIIVINYFVGFLLGLGAGWHNSFSLPQGSWIAPAALTGLLFVAMFLIIGKATIKTGITVTTITTKMSVIIPVTFSILFFREPLGLLKITGIVLALAGVYLTVYKKPEGIKLSPEFIILPIVLFLGVGIIDTLIKYTQEYHNAGATPGVYSTFLFGVAAILSLAARILFPGISTNVVRWDTLPAGIMLGIVNFGSVFFIIEALENSNLDSSIVFGINNLGVVSLSVLIAAILFGERLSIVNLGGLALSFAALILLFIA